MLLKTQTATDIRGLHCNTIYKRDRAGLHNIVTYTKLHRQPNCIEGMRQHAFAKCLEYIKYNYTDEFRSFWQSYGNKQLQWNQKFISYNINRLVIGKPILRYPPEVNIIVNGCFEQGEYLWQHDPAWTINNYKAYYHTSIGKFIVQLPDYNFVAGQKYRLRYEVESIKNAYISSFITTTMGKWYTTKGWKEDIITATKTGINGVGLIAWPTITTGDVVAYNLILD